MVDKPWWDKKYGKNSICGITKTRLRPGKDKNGKSYTIKLPCKHYFYRKALIEWLFKSKSDLYDDNKYKTTCPLCRKEFYFKINKKSLKN